MESEACPHHFEIVKACDRAVDSIEEQDKKCDRRHEGMETVLRNKVNVKMFLSIMSALLIIFSTIVGVFVTSLGNRFQRHVTAQAADLKEHKQKTAEINKDLTGTLTQILVSQEQMRGDVRVVMRDVDELKRIRNGSHGR